MSIQQVKLILTLTVTVLVTMSTYRCSKKTDEASSSRPTIPAAVSSGKF